jgi:hypothetical protein
MVNGERLACKCMNNMPEQDVVFSKNGLFCIQFKLTCIFLNSVNVTLCLWKYFIFLYLCRNGKRSFAAYRERDTLYRATA